MKDERAFCAQILENGIMCDHSIDSNNCVACIGIQGHAGVGPVKKSQSYFLTNISVEVGRSGWVEGNVKTLMEEKFFNSEWKPQIFPIILISSDTEKGLVSVVVSNKYWRTDSKFAVHWDLGVFWAKFGIWELGSPIFWILKFQDSFTMTNGVAVDCN